MRPGKFEGEPDYVENYWSAALSGFADMDDGYRFGFVIGGSDAFEYPELRKDLGRALVLQVDDNGFVWATLMSESAARKVIER